MIPTVQDLNDLLSTLESDDDDERARILRRAQRATVHDGVTPETKLAEALAGQELGSVLSGEAVSHVRSWMKSRKTESTPARPLRVVPPMVQAEPPRETDRIWRKRRA